MRLPDGRVGLVRLRTDGTRSFRETPREGLPANPSHPKLFHTTRPDSAAAIKAGGFSGKRRTSQDGFSGAFFGEGTYLHTDASHSKEYTEGTRAYGYGDETQISAAAHVEKPFVVHAKPGDSNPGALMHNALVRAEVAKPGEKLSPPEITRRLQELGYDAVEVKQPKFSHEIAGSQLVVFDPKKLEAR